MRSASVERRLQRGGKVAKTWRVRGGNHENDVGRGFRQYGGLASVVLLSACHSSCRGCRRRLKESGMLVASRKVRPCNGDECLAPLDPRAFDRPAGGSPALVSGGIVVFRDLFRVRACGRRLASRGLL